MRFIVPLTALLMLAGCSDGPGNILSSPESIASNFTSSLIKGDLNGAKALTMPKSMLETSMVTISNDLQNVPSASFTTKPCVKKTQSTGKEYFFCEGTLASAGVPFREFHVFLQGDPNGKLKAVEIKAYKIAK